MYRKKRRSWTKHVDFMLLDVLCMQLAFVISYIIRFGTDNPYTDGDYRTLAIAFLFIDFFVEIVSDSFKNVLKREYFDEFIATCRHVILVELIVALFFSCGCIAVAFIFRTVVNAWLGKTIEFSNELIGVMCIYYCIYSFCGVSSPIINGLGAVNGVMLLGIFQGIVNIPLSIYLATDGGLGIVGVRFATLILVSIGAVYQFIYFYYTLNKLERV